MTTSSGVDHLSQLDDANNLQQTDLAESAKTSKSRERDDGVRAIFDAVREPLKETASHAATKRLAGMYLKGTLPGKMMEEPDLRTAAMLYERVGAKAEILYIADLMCSDIGRRFSAAEVAKLYMAGGAEGTEKLAQLTSSYINHGAVERSAYAVAVELLDAARDTEGLIRLGDWLVQDSGTDQRDYYWNRAIDAYRRAKADDKLAAIGDSVLENSATRHLAFRAYTAISGQFPEKSAQILISFADRLLEPPSMPHLELALEALKLARASNKLIALGDRLVTERLLTHAVNAYAAAGALDKLLAVGEELVGSFDRSGRSDDYQGGIKAIKAATKLALDSPSAFTAVQNRA